MEEMAKRHAEQDEWLKKLYLNNETSRGNHNKIIQSLETKVKTLTNKVEGRTNKAKFEECKAIYMEDETPLYTPFHYSTKEIEYFSASSGFSDNETQEDEILEGNNGVTKLDVTTNLKKQTPQVKKQNVSYFVEPYEPPIPFPRRLEQHAEEALLYPKEEDPGSLILPCSIRRLDFNNALADLGASISIIPFSMYKRLGMGKLEPINMVIEMADNTKRIPKGIVKNLLIKIDKFMFPVDFVILDMIEDFRMPIILGRPLLATTHAKVDIFRKTISLEVGNEKVIFEMRRRKRAHWCEALSQEKEGLRKYWASCDPHNDICDGGALPNDVERLYWESKNDNEQVDLEWEELSFNNWRKVFNEAELENEKKEDSEEYGESKTNALKIILEMADENCFSSTSDDKNDLGGIIDQLKQNLHEKSTDPDNENHQERKYKLLGIIYKEPPPILIKKIEVTRYNIGLGEIYTGTKNLGIDEKPRTSTNVATVRAVIMDEVGAEGSAKGAT
ncbi:zinc knuckle CX2CX4HX4C containing protein [Tanacetum coccineum]